MRAMTYTNFGDTDVMQIQELDTPTLNPTDVLIEVHASALNPVDTKVRQGAGMYGELPLPIVGGYDVSGTIKELGPKATGFNIGDEVYASPSLKRHGAHAEYVAVDYRTVALKPKSLPHSQAAAVPLALITAWESLYERADIQPGEQVLIQAGAGGVGHFALQLAKIKNCNVITTASRPETIDLCKQLGADTVINHREENVNQRINKLTDNQGVPVILDTVGGATFVNALDAIAYNGRVVSIVYTKTDEIFDKLFRKNATLHLEFMGVPTWNGINPEKQADILTQAAQLIDDGQLKPHIHEIIPLEDLPRAHQEQATASTIGKRVIQLKPD